jgi:hypothetical protein
LERYAYRALNISAARASAQSFLADVARFEPQVPSTANTRPSTSRRGRPTTGGLNLRSAPSMYSQAFFPFNMRIRVDPERDQNLPPEFVPDRL